MALLYGDLDSKDSGQIVARLEQAGVPYELDPSGNQIYVPSEQVARMRVAMAEEGLPNGGSVTTSRRFAMRDDTAGRWPDLQWTASSRKRQRR